MYEFDEIEEFLLDDDLFQHIRGKGARATFDLEAYKSRFPGREEAIDMAVALMRGVEVEEPLPPTSISEKMRQLDRVLEQAKAAPATPPRRIVKQVWGYAAMLALLLGVGAYLHFAGKPTEQQLLSALVNPATTEAVQVLLDDQTLVRLERNNPTIAIAQSGQMTINGELHLSPPQSPNSTSQVVVPYGMRAMVLLPDGSQLWLNSGSSMAFGADFATRRHLYLQGEAYLEVEKNPQCPFTVKTRRMEVEVLGTSFNVADYLNQPQSSVVLVQGSVAVEMGKENYRLTPNHRLMAEQGVVHHQEVEVFNYICWKDGVMIFDGEPLSMVLKSISRYYNTPIHYGERLGDKRYYGTLDLNGPMEEILEFICLTTPLDIQHRDNQVWITTKR